jgi:hypothetical protein
MTTEPKKKTRKRNALAPPIPLTDRVLLNCLAKLRMIGPAGVTVDRLATAAGHSYWISERGGSRLRVSGPVASMIAALIKDGYITVVLPPGAASVTSVGRAFITEAGLAKLEQVRAKMGIPAPDYGFSQRNELIS